MSREKEISKSYRTKNALGVCATRGCFRPATAEVVLSDADGIEHDSMSVCQLHAGALISSAIKGRIRFDGRRVSPEFELYTDLDDA